MTCLICGRHILPEYLLCRECEREGVDCTGDR